MDCVFCKIVSREIPFVFVYKSSFCTAFMDIKPMNPGHVLVIPDFHYEETKLLRSTICSDLFETAKEIGYAMKSGELKAEGINFFLSEGKAAGQEISHIHLHVIPRYTDDGIRLKSPNTHNADLTELKDKASQIIKQMNGYLV